MSHEYKTAAKIIIPIEITGLFILFILSSLLDSMEIFMFFFYCYAYSLTGLAGESKSKLIEYPRDSIHNAVLFSFMAGCKFGKNLQSWL